jgi:hypothetical protein
MLHLVEKLFDNQVSLFIIGLLLTAPPVLGIWAVHEYGWQHWEPFDKGHKK